MNAVSVGKAVWRILRIISIILVVATAGLSTIVGYDASTLASKIDPNRLGNNIVISYNSTHVNISTYLDVPNSGILTEFKINFTINIYANHTVKIGGDTQETILKPGDIWHITFLIQINRTIWEHAESLDIQLYSKGESIIFNQSFIAYSIDVFRSI